jgi:hypothetical protein
VVRIEPDHASLTGNMRGNGTRHFQRRQNWYWRMVPPENNANYGKIVPDALIIESNVSDMSSIP